MGADQSAEQDDRKLKLPLGMYRSSKGAAGELAIQTGLGLVFRSSGRVPWTSPVEFMERLPAGNVYSLPAHPLNAKTKGSFGVLLLHHPGDNFAQEFPGDIRAPRTTVWTHQGPSPEASAARHPAAATAMPSDVDDTNPVIADSAAALHTDATGAAGHTGTPERLKMLEARRAAGPESYKNWLVAEVEKARFTVDEACETLKMAAARKGRQATLRLPDLGDLRSSLGRLSEVQLQEELDRLDVLHQDLKDRTEAFMNDMRTSSMVLRGSSRGLTELTAPDNELLGTDNECGLFWDRRWENQPFGPVDEAQRDRVRYGTRDKVAKELVLPEWGYPANQAQKAPPFCENVHLLVDSSPASKVGSASAGGANLLGRYDALVVRARADFDRNWRFIDGAKRGFWVVHSAAINIGESRKAADFADFSKKGLLDQDAYASSMGHITSNLVKVASAFQVEHLVFFPFGLGAFVRHLGLLDARFEDEIQMQQLRRSVTRKFVEAFKNSLPTTKIHICVSFQEGEAQENADAFLRAFSAADKDLKGRTTIWPDADCLQLAHELAATSRNVMLVNGANRRLIGNHWFARHAKRAIDENLHRRSWTLSALSYLLNRFGEVGASERTPTQLKESVEWIGGHVHDLDGEVPAGDCVIA